jgi:toluene monooxygenase system protein B
MDQVAEKCAYHSVNRRVAPQPDKVMRVRLHNAGDFYPRNMKVSDANWRPTETLDIIFADQ